MADATVKKIAKGGKKLTWTIVGAIVSSIVGFLLARYWGKKIFLDTPPYAWSEILPGKQFVGTPDKINKNVPLSRCLHNVLDHPQYKGISYNFTTSNCKLYKDPTHTEESDLHVSYLQ